MPEMPAERRARYIREFGLSAYEAGVLTGELEVAEYFEAMLPGLRNRKSAANWVMTEVLRAANESAKPLAEAAPKPQETGALLKMVEESRISLNAAKTAFAAMCRSGKGAEATVAELGLAQVSDEAAIAEACDRVLAAESAKVAEYRAGRDKLYRVFRRRGDEGDGRQGKSQGGQRGPAPQARRQARRIERSVLGSPLRSALG